MSHKKAKALIKEYNAKVRAEKQAALAQKKKLAAKRLQNLGKAVRSGSKSLTSTQAHKYYDPRVRKRKTKEKKVKKPKMKTSGKKDELTKWYQDITRL